MVFFTGDFGIPLALLNTTPNGHEFIVITRGVLGVFGVFTAD